MRQPTKFWDRLAKRYSKTPISDESAYQEKLRITREYLRPEMEVLEFGCGTGSTAIAHAPFVKHILAIDFSSKMIEIAQGKADAGKVENITFEQTGVDEFSADGQSYDVVMGHSILHLLKNKERVIAKVHDMLKPGGVFVSSTACMGGKFNILKVILPIGRFVGLLPLVRFFPVQELQDSLTGAGLKIDHQWQPGKGKAVFIVAKRAV